MLSCASSPCSSLLSSGTLSPRLSMPTGNSSSSAYRSGKQLCTLRTHTTCFTASRGLQILFLVDDRVDSPMLPQLFPSRVRAEGGIRRWRQLLCLLREVIVRYRWSRGRLRDSEKARRRIMRRSRRGCGGLLVRGMRIGRLVQGRMRV
jgi:hypothetical protein